MEKETPVIATLCPLCWREEQVKVEGDLPCVECQEAMKKGFLLVGVDFSKPESAENPIRTGHRWIISKEAASQMYNSESLERGAGLIDIKEAKEYGLPIQMYIKPEDKEEKKVEYTLCGICQKPIHKDEFGGIDPVKGFMHQKCKPFELIKP